MNPYSSFRNVQVLDFEFRQMPGERPTPHCCVIRDIVNGRATRHWIDASGAGSSVGKSPLLTDDDSLTITYFGSAEVQCLLSLGWQLPRNHIDLYAECRCLTNGRFLPNGNGLLEALAWFGISSMEACEKAELRELAIRGGPYSDAEKLALLDYCEADVVATSRLALAMAPRINMPHALLRGAYVLTAGRMEHTGTPIDSPMLTRIAENWPVIKPRLIEHIDANYGVFENGSFKQKLWDQWTRDRGIGWPRLPSGVPALDQDTFREMARVHPEVIPMKELRATLSQLRTFTLPVGSDGRNRTMLSPFSSKTGRNQPKSSQFIFGPAKWMRGLIRPEPGRALAYLDYEQQEFGIAAAFSNDANMQAAYHSGDPYLAFAKQAGVVPADATAATHPNERNLFKSCALGVQYGMGIESLAAKTKLSFAHAGELYNLHRSTFPRYWDWSDSVQDWAALHRQLIAAFGWKVEVQGDANWRFLRNFPLQANGAEMLRIACIEACKAGVEICAPVHDALLIEATENAIVEDTEKCRHAMETASEVVLGGFRLRVESEVIRHPDRFPVGNGQVVWDELQRLLSEM